MLTQKQLAYFLAICSLIATLMTAGAMWGNLSARVTSLEKMQTYMWGEVKR